MADLVKLLGLLNFGMKIKKESEGIAMYTYGPVPSWRYGRSLGVDVTTPPKKCTYNCVYCQLGPTEKHVVSPEAIRESLPSTDDIVFEVKSILNRLDRMTVDVLTFSGTGEPTLNLEIGSIVTAIRETVKDLPIVLLTNSSLLPRKDVRTAVLGFDIVTAKFDAGDEDTFKRINHPSKGTFTLEEIHDGIKQLRKETKGMVALEVMLLKGSRGLSNVEGASRQALIDGIVDLDPDLVQIYTPWRPGAVQSIKPISARILQDFATELEQYLEPEKLWVYGVHDSRGKQVNWKVQIDLVNETLTLLKRRPCRTIDVSLSLGVIPAVALRTLEDLYNVGELKREKIGPDVFYKKTHV